MYAQTSQENYIGIKDIINSDQFLCPDLNLNHYLRFDGQLIKINRSQQLSLSARKPLFERLYSKTTLH